MINDLRNDLNNIYRSKKKYLGIRTKERLIIYVIYLKYLCETNELKYEEVINSDKVYDENERFIKSFSLIREYMLSINALIRNFTTVTAKDMLMELINEKDDKSNFYCQNKKRIIYAYGVRYYLDSDDLDIYDVTGNTTYLIIKDKNDDLLEYFKIFDEILGVNNKYQSESEIDFKEYDNLSIFVSGPKYVDNDDANLFGYINKCIREINVSLYSKYYRFSKFSNVPDYINRRIVRYIKTILIKDSNMITMFNKDASEISIINCNNKNMDEIEEIIKKNRKQKDVLVKITYSEIINNGMRIGFNLYQKKKDDNEIDINKIVDENTQYLRRLNDLNEIVERETNKIFNL